MRAAYPGVSAVHLCLDRVLKRPKLIFYTFYIVIAFLDTLTYFLDVDKSGMG